MPCTARAFAGKQAPQMLLDSIEEYFKSSLKSAPTAGVHQTKLPPVFLQRPHHSITIVGIERLRNGKHRLLCFDPSYRPPTAMKKPSKDSWSKMSARLILWRYRRDGAYLRRYRNFEVLFLQIPDIVGVTV